MIISIFVFLFLLLPTLNLVNINISRIMERSSEIGVRKAFGASSRTLVLQFIVENIILTFLGGVIGIVLSIVLSAFLITVKLFPMHTLVLTLRVVLYGSCLSCFWCFFRCLSCMADVADAGCKCLKSLLIKNIIIYTTYSLYVNTFI